VAPVVAGPLAPDRAQRVVGELAVELVDRHHVGEIEHVDLLQLGGGAEFGRHHVHGDVGDLDDGGVALADARGLDDDDVEARCPTRGDDRRQGGGTSDAEPRVARERKKIWSPPMAFMRIRSPSSAPPPRRRVGSMARTAMRSLSSWSSRNRRTSFVR